MLTNANKRPTGEAVGNHPEATARYIVRPRQPGGGAGLLNRWLPGKPAEKPKRREFEKLAREHYRDVFRAAYRLTNDLDEAADLTQEAFVKAYLFFHQFRPGTNFRAWMLRILANTHISRYRQRSRRPATTPWDEVTDSSGRETQLAAETAPGPEEIVIARFTDEEIDAALAQLPEEFRIVAIMADIYEMPYKEIAETLDIPIGTVRSRLFRARRLLRRYLSGYVRRRLGWRWGQ